MTRAKMLNDPDEIIPRGPLSREFHVCPRTIARWEKAKLAGFDEPIEINGRIYHRRRRVELAKRRPLQENDD
jgi:hypothetical protein